MEEGDSRTDLRGVFRGQCTECQCRSFLRSQHSAACSVCSHAPTKHINLGKKIQMSRTGQPASYHAPSTSTYASVTATTSSKKPASVPESLNTDLTRQPLHTQAQPALYPGHSAATTAYPHMHTSQHTCLAAGCYKPVHLDPMLGYFSYCSPQCRDEHLLPDYNRKLEAAIANFEANPPPSSFKKTSFEVVRQLREIKSREPLGIIFARKDGTKIMVSGLSIKKFGEHLKNGQIKLHDILFKICDNQVGVSTTVKHVEDIISPRTIISMILDSTYAVDCDLREFLKTAKKFNATHVFALWPFEQSDYGLSVMDNKESVVICGTSKNSPARECGVQVQDRVICYSSYADKRLLEICKAKGRDQFIKDLYNAGWSNSTLILAIIRM